MSVFFLQSLQSCFVARQLLLQIYALSSVKYPHLKLRLCKKMTNMRFVQLSYSVCNQVCPGRRSISGPITVQKFKWPYKSGWKGLKTSIMCHISKHLESLNSQLQINIMKLNSFLERILKLPAWMNAYCMVTLLQLLEFSPPFVWLCSQSSYMRGWMHSHTGYIWTTFLACIFKCFLITSAHEDA